MKFIKIISEGEKYTNAFIGLKSYSKEHIRISFNFGLFFIKFIINEKVKIQFNFKKIYGG